MNNDKLKVLMELRPSLEGFAGIPQETRLEFLSLNNLDNVDVTGLINHPFRQLRPGLWRGRFAWNQTPHRRIHRLSRMALSVKVDPMEHWWLKIVRYVGKKISTEVYSLKTIIDSGVRVYEFDATNFGDFIWQMLFSKTLSAREFETIHGARYASIQPSWDLLTQVAIRRMRLGSVTDLVRLNTQKYDVFLSQTPWPGSLPRCTQLVVRYHDAIPIFLPHSIPNASVHQHAHMASLLANQKQGIFACVSAATRTDLLKIFPKLENRSVVIPDIVSHEYYQEVGTEKYISSIVRNHICPETEPRFLTENENFYQRNLLSKPARFIMMVSTLEPRKNHLKLIGAWDYLKNHGMDDLKLIIVGELGWDFNRILDSMAPWQQRGELFHLHRVPSAQLRVLYNAADAVICPSVAEGFDLSGIEAMLCGGAVIASDIPVHREVYRGAAEYFDPYSALAQAKSVESVIHPDQQVRRQELIASGLKHAQRFRRENIEPYWQDLFERIRGGVYKKALDEDQLYLNAPEPRSD
jgi:hypothetical protein